jgi:DNA transposition AAA+ family ATPase
VEEPLGNLTPEALEQFLNEMLESDLAGFFMPDDADERFIATTSARTALSRIKAGVEDSAPFVMLTGPSGCGKSEVGRKFAREKEAFISNQNRFYLETRPKMEASALLEELAVNLRISRIRRFNTLLGMIRDSLLLAPCVAVVDEVQRLDKDGIDTLRYLADQTGSTWVLICEDEFADGVTRARNVDNRVFKRYRMGPTPKEELATLPLLEGFEAHTTEEIHALTGGVLRDVVRLVRSIDELVRLNSAKGLTRAAFKPNQVRVAARKLDLVRGRR